MSFRQGTTGELFGTPVQVAARGVRDGVVREATTVRDGVALVSGISASPCGSQSGERASEKRLYIRKATLRVRRRDFAQYLQGLDVEAIATAAAVREPDAAA